jgi:hypothetical protein
VDRGGEAGVGFVVAGGDAAELLEPLETILDQVTPLVLFGVVRSALAGMTAMAPRSFRMARNFNGWIGCQRVLGRLRQVLRREVE